VGHSDLVPPTRQNIRALGSTVIWCGWRGWPSVKAADYFACDDYWLLVIVDWRDNAQEQEISVGHVKIASSVFQRIIVYKPGFDDVLVVWP
jgi:hypothetical protein